LAWIITFGAVVILDIDFGLYIGIAFSLLLIIVQSQRASASILGNIPYTDIYESIDICEDVIPF
jgi:MFS superfamily sulfate permease-like transporter